MKINKFKDIRVPIFFYSIVAGNKSPHEHPTHQGLGRDANINAK